MPKSDKTDDGSSEYKSTRDTIADHNVNKDNGVLLLGKCCLRPEKLNKITLNFHNLYEFLF